MPARSLRIAQPAARPAARSHAPRKSATGDKAARAGRTTLVTQAYASIRKRILDNVFPPGHQVLEQALAEELGISRTPLREALVRLAEDGLVEVVPRHGMRVLPVSPADMAEIYIVLTALEGAAAEIVAARRPSKDELRPLIEATQDMEAALKKDDLDRWAAADERFHQTLVALAGNRMLAQTVANFWDRAHRARLVTLRMRPKPVNSTREHMALVERLLSGDVTGAIEVNKAHRSRASRELLALFERLRLQQL
jgi:DNA-binding GntR family transcriptional regulator